MTQETNPSQASTLPQRVPFLRRLLTNRRLWAILIVVLGLWLMFFFGTRTLRAYRELEYAREQGLLNGTASVDAIQPWMNIRYIAVAYAVPEEYIYAKLEIPFDRRSEREPIGRIGRQRRDEASPPSETTKVPPANPQAARNAAVQQMREIILAYRENPVAPGLRDIRPWMSLAYIANSTGVPLDYLLDSLATTAQMIQATETAGRDSPPPPDMRSELAREEAPYKPLDLLSDELHYPGGPEGLLNAVRDALDTYTDEPAQE